MNRRVVAAVVLALPSLAGVRAGASQSVDDIIARHVQARGGLEKLKAVQTLKKTGNVTFTTPAGTFSGSQVTYSKRPNLTRQEVDLDGRTTINAFDGEVSWVLAPFMGLSTDTSSEDAVKEYADFDGPLVDYKAKGYTVELVGTELAGGRQVHDIRLTAANQRVQHCYLDVETNLELKRLGNSPAGPLEQQFSDYRDVEGLKMPFLINHIVAGTGNKTKLQIRKVEINAKFDDKIFRVPKR